VNAGQQAASAPLDFLVVRQLPQIHPWFIPETRLLSGL
jgi:hypothetical protein